MRALPGRDARVPGLPPYPGGRVALPVDRDWPVPGLVVPDRLQAQVDKAAADELARRAEVDAVEREHAEATAARAWERMPDLDGRLLDARQAQATAAGQLEGLRAAARDVAERMQREQVAVADEMRRAQADAAEDRAVAAERAADAALASRLTDFWAAVAGAQQAFRDFEQLETEVRRHRQERNDAKARRAGEQVPARALGPNRTSALLNSKRGVRELLEMRP